MTAWTMRFRIGNAGKHMWPQCFKFGVAAITYDPLSKIDLSDYPPNEPKELWSQLEPPQKYSLSKVAYEMRRGDVIYVRYQGRIISKGTVKRRYQFDNGYRITELNGEPWSHQVPVNWVNDFAEFPVSDIGPDKFTVWKLLPEQLERIESLESDTVRETEKQEAIEGKLITREAQFRSRNRALIEAKKSSSDYSCEACGFSFGESYGPNGEHYIIAHHLEQLSNRRKATKTTLDDIALLCANCHVIAHKEDPPLKIERLRALVEKHRERKK